MQATSFFFVRRCASGIFLQKARGVRPCAACRLANAFAIYYNEHNQRNGAAAAGAEIRSASTFLHRTEELMKRLGKHFLHFLRRTDLALLLVCIACSAFGLVLLYGIGISGHVRVRTITVQAAAVLLGVVVALMISMVDYHTIARLWKFYLPASCFLVALTYFVGMRRSGYEHVDDRAWLAIPFTGRTFQPSEILKLALILSLALHLANIGEQINRPRPLAGLLLHGGAITLMIVLQGDDGTAMVFAIIVAAMLFAAGLDLRYIAAVAAAGLAAVPAVWFGLLDENKRQRFRVLFDPSLDPRGAGWQQNLSLTAIGSGQITGKGILTGAAQYVPEMYNDFIFAFIGESIGFLGCLGVFAMIAAVCVLLLRNAWQARDPLGRYLCVGVFALLGFQSLWGIGMALSLLPVAGLTVPFFSAGGTSVVVSYAAIGLVLSVHRYAEEDIFGK